MEPSILPVELSNVLRFSLKARRTSDNPEFDTSNPAIRRLVEAILFSRKFILTYYIALGVLLLGFTLLHYSTETSRKWKRNLILKHHDAYRDNDLPSSSSSGTSSPSSRTIKLEDLEDLPLLSREYGKTFKYNSLISYLWKNLASFLSYQPGPIYAITSPRNHLPSNGLSILIITFFALNVFYLLFHTSFSIFMLFAFSDRAALLFVANLPILYLFSAKNNGPIQFLTGWSYEGLNIFHRRLGEWMVALGAFHSISMFGVWYTLLRPTNFTLVRFLSSRVILLGLFAVVAYILIYFTSIGWMRKLCYELFLASHIILQFAALIFLFFHHHNSRPYVVITLVIWVLDRVLSRIMLSTRRFVGTLQVAKDGNTVLLNCDIPIARPRSGLPLRIGQGWQAGQHVFITIPELGRSHSFQTHPFTIASPAPPTDMTNGHWPLQLIIRARDGFSKDLLDFADQHKQTHVWIDGPYGSVETLKSIQHADQVCLVAGGSGIAVTYPLAWAMLMEQSIVATHLPIAKKENFTHIWVRQDFLHQDWIDQPFQGRTTLSLVAGNASKSPTELISKTFETRGLLDSRPDIKTELCEWVESLHHANSKAKRQTICVVVSGPDGLVRDVRNFAASLIRAGYHIDVHVEKFGW